MKHLLEDALIAIARARDNTDSSTDYHYYGRLYDRIRIALTEHLLHESHTITVDGVTYTTAPITFKRPKT